MIEQQMRLRELPVKQDTPKEQSGTLQVDASERRLFDIDTHNGKENSLLQMHDADEEHGGSKLRHRAHHRHSHTHQTVEHARTAPDEAKAKHTAAINSQAAEAKKLEEVSDREDAKSETTIKSAEDLDRNGVRKGTYLYNRNPDSEGFPSQGDMRVSFAYFSPVVAGSDKNSEPEVTVLALQQRIDDAATHAWLDRWETTNPELIGRAPIAFVWDQDTSWKIGLRDQTGMTSETFLWAWRIITVTVIYIGFMLLLEPKVEVGTLCGEGCRKTQQSCHGGIRFLIGLSLTFFVISLLAAIMWGAFYNPMLILPLGIVALACLAVMCLMMFKCRRRVHADADAPTYRSPYVGAKIVIIEARPGQGMQGTIIGPVANSNAWIVETVDGRQEELLPPEFVLKQRDLHAEPTKGAIVFIPRPATDIDLEGEIMYIRDHPRPLAPGERRPTRQKFERIQILFKVTNYRKRKT